MRNFIASRQLLPFKASDQIYLNNSIIFCLLATQKDLQHDIIIAVQHECSNEKVSTQVLTIKSIFFAVYIVKRVTSEYENAY